MLNVVFIVTALLVSVAPVMAGIIFTFYEGVDCTGSVIGTSTGSSAGECIYLSNGGLAKSIGYSGASDSDSIYFYESAQDCTSSAPLILGGESSGCATAGTGFYWGSVSWV